MRTHVPMLLLTALLPLGAFAQQPGGSSYYQMPSASRPPAAAEHQPRKLAPRSSASPSGLAKPIAPTAGGAIGTVAGSLGIVLGVFFVIAWCSRRFAPAGSGQLPKEAVETLGRAPFSAKQQLLLLRVGSKLLLLADSPAGARALSEITDAAEVEHLTALCRRGQPGSSSAAFRQVLNQIAAEPAPGGFLGEARRNTRGGR